MQASSSAHKAMHVDSWPPLVFLLLGVVTLVFWLAGTAVQVQTSEAWFRGVAVEPFSLFSTFGEVGTFISGNLATGRVIPFVFAWGVQIALIVASVGVEMPKFPAWRYYTSWGVVILLVGVNSAGDYASSAAYGLWGQVGFTLVILFATFCLGLLSVTCFAHAFRKMFP